MFGRNSDIPTVDHKLSKRELFSICGKLVGHYPVAGWLRLACSFVKRHSEGTRWGDFIGDTAQAIIEDIVDLTKKDDPVKGKWGGKAANQWGKAGNQWDGVV